MMTASTNAAPARGQRRLSVTALAKHQLALRIARDWVPGQRLPKLGELARAIGAGQRNTHRALRELTEEGFLVARPGMGTFVATDLDLEALGALQQRDHPNLPRAGSADRLGGKRISMLAVKSAPGSPIVQIIEAAQRELEFHGAEVSLQWKQPLEASKLQDDAADGLFVFASDPRTPVTFGTKQVAVIVRAGEAPAIGMGAGYDLIHPCGQQGGFLVGEHLRQAELDGPAEVAFLGRRSLDRHAPMAGCLAAYDVISAVRLGGLELGLGRQVPRELCLVSERYDDRSAAQVVPAYLALSPRPRTIFAASDDLALGFIVGASSHGLEVGRDYYIVGFDGQLRGRELYGGPLATVAASFGEIGRRAARLLTGRLLSPEQPVRHIALGCTLRLGATLPALSDGSMARAARPTAASATATS